MLRADFTKYEKITYLYDLVAELGGMLRANSPKNEEIKYAHDLVAKT